MVQSPYINDTMDGEIRQNQTHEERERERERERDTTREKTATGQTFIVRVLTGA